MTHQAPINEKSVVLASGGARGITAQCIIYLAQKHPANYILLGRSSIDKPLPDWLKHCPDDAAIKRQIMTHITKQGKKPTPQIVNRQFLAIRAHQEIEKTLKQIRATSSQVEYISVDVTNGSTMKQQLAGSINKYGPVTGIIHGAGALADHRIEKKTEQDFDKVTSPKIGGLKNLLMIAPIKTLDFLVLFSSIAGFYGNIGQTDYAIANEVLNKAAYQAKRENPNCRVLSINWGPWDSGMVTPELKRAFAQRNMPLIPSASGAEWMQKELFSINSNVDHPVQIVVGAIPTRSAGQLPSELKNHLIKRHLSLDINPFLEDHRIGHNPVLPATCAASWIATTCEQLYPGYSVFEIQAFKVLKGIVFDQSLAQEHFLELTELEKISQEKILFSAKIFSNGKNGKPLFHYTANILVVNELPPAPMHQLPALLNNSGDAHIQSDRLYHDGTLFHGPSFQGVKQILDITQDRLILHCHLPEIPTRMQGQFPVQTVNPFINDAIVQSLLIWTQHFVQTPCLPSSLKCLQQYRAIPFDQSCWVEMQIISQTDTSVLANLIVVDQNRKVLTKFTQLQGTISPLLKRFIGRKKVISD